MSGLKKKTKEVTFTKSLKLATIARHDDELERVQLRMTFLVINGEPVLSMQCWAEDLTGEWTHLESQSLTIPHSEMKEFAHAVKIAMEEAAEYDYKLPKTVG